MKEELIKQMDVDLQRVSDYDVETNEFAGWEACPHVSIHYDIMAKELIDRGWTKQIWHKVSQNDLPTRQGQKVWLCTTSKDYFMANYYDDAPFGGKQFFETANAGRITLSNVLAWAELPKYKE